MPIRPENRARYPKEWPLISDGVRARAKNRCEWPGCGVQNGSVGYWRGDKFVKTQPNGDRRRRDREYPVPGTSITVGGVARRIIRIILTVAHLDHTPENCDPANLKCWCQRHHNRYDAKMRTEGKLQRARALKASADLFQKGELQQ